MKQLAPFSPASTLSPFSCLVGVRCARCGAPCPQNPLLQVLNTELGAFLKCSVSPFPWGWTCPMEMHHTWSQHTGCPQPSLPQRGCGAGQRWVKLLGDVNLLPATILPHATICKMSPTGFTREMKSPETALGQSAMKIIGAQTPGLFSFSEFWHKQREFSPDELFPLRQPLK